MILKLIESRRARVLAGWAFGASVVLHAASVGGWVGRELLGGGGDGGGAAEGPISVRYLLPRDHEAAQAGEHVDFVAVGASSTGWVQADAAGPETNLREGDAAPQRAAQPLTDVPDGDLPDETRLYTAEDVDSAATRDPSSDGPRYPDALRTKGVQGHVLVEFAVDTAGRADPATFTVVQATDPLFAEAVREALPRMHFIPARTRGRAVRQLVRLPMQFRLIASDTESHASTE